MRLIKSTMVEKRQGESMTFRDLFHGDTLRALVAGAFMQFAQQWSGIGFVLQFSTDIFQVTLHRAEAVLILPAEAGLPACWIFVYCCDQCLSWRRRHPSWLRTVCDASHG